MDAQGRQSYVNAEFARMLGWPAEELAGAEPPFAYWPAEEHARIAEFFVRLRHADAAPEAALLPFVRRDGSRFDALVVPSVHAVAGDTGGMTATVLDLGTLRRTGGAPGAEADMREILNGLGEPVVAYDDDWRYRYLNYAAAEVFRTAGHGGPADLLGQRLWDVYPDLVGTHFEREMRRAAEERVPVAFEEHYARNGRWSEIRCDPLPHGGIAVVWKDITARKRADETLHYLVEASRILGASLDYEETLTALAHAVVPRLADWCTISVLGDDARVRQLAVAHADADKVRWARELSRRYPPDPERSAVHRVIRTGEPELRAEVTDEMIVQVAQDEEHLRLLREVGFRSAMMVPLTARGHTFGALTLISAELGRRYTEDDLALAAEIARRAALAVDNARLYRESERSADELREQAAELELQNVEMQAQAAQLEEMQARLETHNADLRSTNLALADASAAAEAASQAKSDFLATMSHELRTPLNAMLGYTELLLLGVPEPIPGAARTQVERIAHAARHLRSVIDEILTFSRIEAGRESVETERVPLRDVLEEVAAVVQPLAERKGLALHLPAPAAAESLETDPGKLRQILINLLGNAVKFTEHGSVWFDVRRERDDLCFRVRDTGEGIAPEHMDAIFEPFRQVRGALTRPAEGTGLGLAVSRRLARLLGGDISVQSVPGRGSTFTLRLPARRSGERAPAAAAE